MNNEQFMQALRERGWTFEARQWIPRDYRAHGIVGMASLRHEEKGLSTAAEVFAGESLWELAYRKALLAEQGQLEEEIRDALYDEFVKRAAGEEPEETGRNFERWQQIQAIAAVLDAVVYGDLATTAITMAVLDWHE